jgi:hypothetical protein
VSKGFESSGFALNSQCKGSELVFFRPLITGSRGDGEIQPEDFCPKANCYVVFLITSPRARHLKKTMNHASHGELWEQIVINDREGELEAATKSGVIKIRIHCRLSHSLLLHSQSGNVCTKSMNISRVETSRN